MGSGSDHRTPVDGITAIEVVFCSTSRNVAELDCIDASRSEAGRPFVMSVGLPSQQPWSAAAERVLARWARRSAVVCVEVREGHDTPKVRLAAEDTALLLDLTVAGQGPSRG